LLFFSPTFGVLSFSVELHHLNSVSSFSAVVWILGTFPRDNLTVPDDSS